MSDEIEGPDRGEPVISDVEGVRLARYFAGECSPEEAVVVEAWIAVSAERQTVVEELRAAWEAARREPRSTHVAAAWERVKARHDAETVGEPALHLVQTPKPQRRSLLWVERVGTRDSSSRWRRLLPFAAGVLAASVAIWAAGIERGRQSTAVRREYATGAAERETVTLADGTQITLAPATRLRVAADFGRSMRRVVLVEGEAYFVVAHDERRPFAVQSRRAVAQDIGTQFDVRAYAEDFDVRVVVTDGAVSFGDSASIGVSRAIVRRGMMARVDSGGQPIIETGIDANRYVDWVRGVLVFHDTPLSDVARELSRWYGLDVRVVGDTLGAQLFTGAYTTESPDQVLRLITETTGSSYERVGSTVKIRAR